MSMTVIDEETTESPPPLARRPMPAGRAIITMLVAFAVAAVCAAPSLERVAERQGYGGGRDVALAITRPLASVSHALFLDRPREWLASWTGHGDPPKADTFGAGVTVPTAATTVPTTVPSGPAVTITRPLTPTTSGLSRRTPTAGAPLKVWMGGDSLMGTVSDQVGALVAGDPRVALTADVQVGTGLVRSDVLDWPTELTERMASVDPDVVVLSYGGNDDQPLHPPDGSFVALFTPEWQVEYARRVGIMMDIASNGGARTVLWLGLPAERPENLDGAKNAMNAAASEEAAKRPSIAFVPLGPALQGSDGGYSDTITAPDGSTITARASDGVHLTPEGAAAVAPLILDAFALEWHLR
ncbi:MAG: DUF459 domain-containing protein [Acidimicrobiales bacterium]